MSGFPTRSSFGARGGGKPKIRAPRKPNPESTVQTMWERLAAGIKEIQNHNASSLSYEEHYRYAYNMVLYKHADQLYNGVRALIAEHLDYLASTQIVPAFPRTDPYYSSNGAAGSSSGAAAAGSSSSSGRAAGSGGSSYETNGKGSAQAVERAIEGDLFLKSVKGVWEDHTASMRKVRAILKYLDIHYTHSAGVPYIIDASLHLFLLHIIRSPHHPISSHLMHTLLSQIRLERDGETVARSTIRECIDILLRLSTLPPSPPSGSGGSAGSDSGFGASSSTSAAASRQAAMIAAMGQNGAHTVYQVEFEPRFLETSREFYRDEAEEGVERGDAAGYLRNVSRRLAEENDRTQNYLSPSTSPAIRSLLISTLLTPHLEDILNMPNTGLRPMLDDDRMEDLALLYTLYVQVPDDQGKNALKQGIRADIEERGKAINAGAAPVKATVRDAVNGQGRNEPRAAGSEGMDFDEVQVKQEPGEPDDDTSASGLTRDKGKGKAQATISATTTVGAAAATGALAPGLAQAVQWVQDVLDLKDKFDRILEKAFAGDKSVQTSINEAFQSFINAHQRAPEFLSLFIDEHLKKGTKTKSEDEIEAALEKTITLFRFLTDRDKFETFYKKHLARRLLAGKSVSDDAEKGMVAKLKVEMGFQFTQKLEGMFTDMRISAEGANALRNWTNKKSIALPLDLTVSVLTTSHWPPNIAAASPLTLPPILTECTSAFEQYYNSRHNGRRLTWQGNQGNVDMRIKFKNRKHDVGCTTQAACVLLCFEDLEDGQTLGYEDIQSRTSMADADLTRTLQSIACGKYRILLKSPKGREVNKSDKFMFNDAFTCPLARFKIAMVAAKVETAKEKEETEGMVEEERRHQIEACIVRIMKNRKVMSHNDLISEVAQQLSRRFAASVGSIKKRIEGLIEREYLERDTEEKGRYRYLA